MKNYYQLLGVDSAATSNAIITAYNEKIAVADVSDEALTLLKIAVDTLLDHTKRADHDIYIIADTHVQAGRFQSAIFFLENKIKERNDYYWFQIASYCIKGNLLSRAMSILDLHVKKKEEEYFCLLSECYSNMGLYHSCRYEWSNAIKQYQLALQMLEKKQNKNDQDFQTLCEICKNLLNLHHVNNDKEQAGLYHKMLTYEASRKAFKSSHCASSLFSVSTKKIKPEPIPLKQEWSCAIS